MGWTVISGVNFHKGKDRTPIQTVDVVTLDGMNWSESHSVLTRSPVYDHMSGVVNVHYNLAVDGYFIGNVSDGKMSVWLGLSGLFDDPNRYALVDRIHINGFTIDGGSIRDIYTVNPENQQTNMLEFMVISEINGFIRGRVMIGIEFTLPNDSFSLGKPDW